MGCRDRPNPSGSDPTPRRVFRELEHSTIAPAHVHDIADESDTVAASVHVYSPPLETMHHVEVTPDAALCIIRRVVMDARPFTFG